jgi:small subunit ribosomal protein S9
VNERPIEKYFCTDLDRASAIEPLVACQRADKYDIFVRVEGSGPTGQAGAIKLGLARALQKAEAELNTILKQHKYLTRDPRMKERKKYGLHGARRGQQYSKR